ncbi:23S rRNA (guanosine(2251)-2'-O)-methyltransferase RlmB [Geomesophilobacter sediminis]|uniref:23S rRNA (Guanosine(2251)-2'-O)-methyltransferase RlmB n=1 Tax=Geomesophilobacter sediminis TaxID=2798584 RepID=A0A8J7M3G6_9BACT|nr:23S rRNA (guanosine(2251)-2'-O)-methyltransferase RlmB [Geomesophilobacter sediminis]MBJ6727947.1 23S rRNA (guanosine(2251)-2'-O)-methyltransferase RlmB [Geomesophilobacter sediminis]
MPKEEIIYGLNPVMEALRGSRKIFELFLAGSQADKRLEKVLKLAAERKIPVRQRDRGDLQRLCGTDHHQGIALKVEPFPYADFDEVIEGLKGNQEALVLVLDSVQDPHNLGALIRSAACAGAHAVVIPKDRAAGVTAAAEKASAGATETIAVVQVVNIAKSLEALKEAGFWIYGADGAARRTLYEQNLTGPVALVIGGEGEGIRQLVRKSCDELISIPLQGGVNSLNASVAGGIFLFEVVRQRLQKASAEAPR